MLQPTPRLSYSDLPLEVKRIANECLGIGVLRSLFSYDYTYHLILKISDGVLAGFALYHFEEPGRLNVDRIGVLDCVCVSTPYRQNGFGTFLTYNALKKMSAQGVCRIEAMLKVPRSEDEDALPGVPLLGSSNLLSALGFRAIKEFDNYYAKRSVRYDYECAFCGNKPDTCTAVLYTIQR